MCNCNSQWQQNARDFVIENPDSNEAVIVNFLIENNHCGAANGIYLDALVHYYNQQLNSDLSREAFQHGVLIPLKQRGFICSLPYPGTNGGIFIPCNETEIFVLMEQVLSRVESELSNILIISETTSRNTQIRRIINSIPNE